MDRRKLNKAADNHYEEEADFYRLGITAETLIIDAFKSGAEWLMGLPLADRLTDAEIAMARAAYSEAKKGYAGNDDILYAIGRVVKTVLEGIFGIDLFKENLL